MTPPLVLPGGDRVLVALHGHGDVPASLEHRRDEIDPGHGATVVVPAGPVALEEGGRAWFSDHGGADDAASLVAVLDEAIDEGVLRATTGPPHVALLGWSQGAAAALAYACRPDAPAVAGIVAVAGWLPPLDGLEWRPGPRLRVLMLHPEDDEVVPLPMGRSTARFLDREGAQVTWRTVPGGHTLTPAVLHMAAGWLAELPRA